MYIIIHKLRISMLCVLYDIINKSYIHMYIHTCTIWLKVARWGAAGEGPSFRALICIVCTCVDHIIHITTDVYHKIWLNF